MGLGIDRPDGQFMQQRTSVGWAVDQAVTI
jgi:hypothetical protein